jgi:predicted MFS family arabinose efflux permease
MRNTALWSIVAVNLLGHIGIAMPYPIFAPLFIGTQATDIARSGELSPILLFALLMAVYPLGTLVGSLYLGRLSDRVGRRTVILGTLLLAAGTNVLAAYAIVVESYPLLFAARFLTGICEGNISVARAVLTDLDLRGDKAVAFGYLNSAGYAGYLVGPLLGGYLSHVHFSAPFFLAAVLSVLAALACRIFMPETRAAGPEPAARDVVPLWKEPGLRVLLGIQFLTTLTINVYHEFFPALMVDNWDATPEQISYATIIATTTMITLSVFGMRRVLARWNTGQLYFSSMVMLGLSVALFAVPDRLLLVYPVFVVFGVSLAIFNSTSNTWLSDTYAHVGQGRLLGVVTSMFFLSNIVAAVLGGLVADRSITAVMVIGAASAVLAGIAFKLAVRTQCPRPVERRSRGG